MTAALTPAPDDRETRRTWAEWFADVRRKFSIADPPAGVSSRHEDYWGGYAAALDDAEAFAQAIGADAALPSPSPSNADAALLVAEAREAVAAITPGTRDAIEHAERVQAAQRAANFGFGAGTYAADDHAAEVREEFSKVLGTAQAMNALLVLKTLTRVVPQLAAALQALRKDSERLDAIPALMFLDEGDGRDFGPVQINRDADGVTRFYAYLDGCWLPMDTLRAAIDAAALNTTRAGEGESNG